MEILVPEINKYRMVSYGAFRIFGADKLKLSKPERIERFNLIWKTGLKEALEKAIIKQRIILAEYVKEKLRNSNSPSVEYVNQNLTHYEFFYKRSPCIAQLKHNEASDQYTVDQLWTLTYSDLPAEVFCFEFDTVSDKELFIEIAKQHNKDPRKLAKQTLLETIEKLKNEKASLEEEIEHLNKERKKSNISYFLKVLEEFRQRLKGDYKETSGNNNWQSWIYKNNWLFGVHYGTPLEKQRIGFESIPDFLFPTLDGFLDVLEIKTPKPKVIREDSSHPGAFLWTPETSEAIGQVVNYLHEIEINQLLLAKKIKEKYAKKHPTVLYTIKPRAYILIGKSEEWDERQKEAFRKLNYSLHEIEVLTYNDLLKRGENIVALYMKEIGNNS